MTLNRHTILFFAPLAFAVLAALGSRPSAKALEIHSAVWVADSTERVKLFQEMGEVPMTKLGASLPPFLQDAYTVVERSHGLVLFAIFGGFCLLALLIPPRATARSKANALTTLAVGFLVAWWIGGFHPLDWPEFLIWAVSGFCAAFAIVLLRGHLVARHDCI